MEKLQNEEIHNKQVLTRFCSIALNTTLSSTMDYRYNIKLRNTYFLSFVFLFCICIPIKNTLGIWVRVLVFNATFNDISAISWQSVLLVEETGVSGENQQPVASH